MVVLYQAIHQQLTLVRSEQNVHSFIDWRCRPVRKASYDADSTVRIVMSIASLGKSLTTWSTSVCEKQTIFTTSYVLFICEITFKALKYNCYCFSWNIPIISHYRTIIHLLPVSMIVVRSHLPLISSSFELISFLFSSFLFQFSFIIFGSPYYLKSTLVISTILFFTNSLYLSTHMRYFSTYFL